MIRLKVFELLSKYTHILVKFSRIQYKINLIIEFLSIDTFYIHMYQ